MLEELLANVRSTGPAVELETSGDLPGLSAGVDLAAYRVIQEALTNTLRHAAATRAHVRLHHRDDRVELEVRDDGQGPACWACASGSASSAALSRPAQLWVAVSRSRSCCRREATWSAASPPTWC